MIGTNGEKMRETAWSGNGGGRKIRRRREERKERKKETGTVTFHDLIYQINLAN